MACHSTRFSPIVAFAVGRTLPNRTNLIHNVALFCFCRIGKALGSGFFLGESVIISDQAHTIRYDIIRNGTGWDGS